MWFLAAELLASKHEAEEESQKSAPDTVYADNRGIETRPNRAVSYLQEVSEN